MRMDQNQTLSAYEVVNDYPYEALVRIFSATAKINSLNKLLVRLNKQEKLNLLRQQLSLQI